ncbi:MAG: HAMP domain-containing histidine kinase [Burkholderiaceae bacterium]|nr:HAMP domain-containing histidine kinase [Burkholderiaceae bacterium]
MYPTCGPLRRISVRAADHLLPGLRKVGRQRGVEQHLRIAGARRVHEAQLRRVQRLTLQAQRRFVDDASHQLRTPLTTLATQVGFALREQDAGKREQALWAIKQQVDDAIRQTNQMLALARADAMALPTGPVDVQLLAEEAIKSLWSVARQNGIDLGFEPLRDAVAVGADGGGLPAAASSSQLAVGNASQLAEALSNLVHNALVHVPAGGRVTVQAGLEGVGGTQAVLRVVDNGPGILPADRGRAVERFLRLHTPSNNATVPQGSGLGLAIANAIVQRHGGTLELADAEPGAHPPGLAVTLRWPATPALSAVAA